MLLDQKKAGGGVYGDDVVNSFILLVFLAMDQCPWTKGWTLEEMTGAR